MYEINLTRIPFCSPTVVLRFGGMEHWHLVPHLLCGHSTERQLVSNLSLVNCYWLDFRMEMKKASPPSRRQKLLGVIFPFDDQGLTISPCRDRLSKIKNLINQALQDDRLTPLEAQRLADKLVFLQTTAFGQVGKSAMQSIYSRSAASDDGQHHLNTGLRSSLTVLGTCLCCLDGFQSPLTHPKR